MADMDTFFKEDEHLDKFREYQSTAEYLVAAMSTLWKTPQEESLNYLLMSAIQMKLWDTPEHPAQPTSRLNE